MTTLRDAAQMALEALMAHVVGTSGRMPKTHEAITALRAAMATGDKLSPTEPDLSRCPKCNGPADNGHDRCIPPNTYWCSKCMAEPPQRKPLTDEEIWNNDKIMAANSGYGATFETLSDALRFTRAVERAHGIGGEE